MVSKTQTPERSIQRRMTAEDRRKAIVLVAAELFSVAGFKVSTRDIAERCKITQAALYKHFASKDALIDAVFRSCFLDRDRSSFADALARENDPLKDRITQAYGAFFAEIDRVNQRLFLRAAMEGYQLPSEYSAPLDHEILEPLIAQLRIDGNLPSLESTPLRSEERELALLLHGSIVFLAVRRNVYNIDLDDRIDWVIEQDVDVWLTGARKRLNTIWAS